MSRICFSLTSGKYGLKHLSHFWEYKKSVVLTTIQISGMCLWVKQGRFWRSYSEFVRECCLECCLEQKNVLFMVIVVYIISTVFRLIKTSSRFLKSSVPRSSVCEKQMPSVKFYPPWQGSMWGRSMAIAAAGQEVPLHLLCFSLHIPILCLTNKHKMN